MCHLNVHLQCSLMCEDKSGVTVDIIITIHYTCTLLPKIVFVGRSLSKPLIDKYKGRKLSIFIYICMYNVHCMVHVQFMYIHVLYTMYIICPFTIHKYFSTN